MKLTWPDFKFPPINLFNKPIQEEYEYMLQEIADIRSDRNEIIEGIAALNRLENALKPIQKIAEKRLADLNFIYYTRTGRFL